MNSSNKGGRNSNYWQHTVQCRIFDHHTGFLKYLLSSCSLRLKWHTHQEFTAKYSQNQKAVVVHKYFCIKLINSKDLKIKMSQTPTLCTQLQFAKGQLTPLWLRVCCCGADAIPKKLHAHLQNWARQGGRNRPRNNQKYNHSTPSCCAERTWINICRKPSTTACYFMQIGRYQTSKVEHWPKPVG